jgi:pimeloyl-ACP methyl ester carboxylesterase
MEKIGTRMNAAVKSFFVDGWQGVRIHVLDYGGEGAPLLFCHCTGTVAQIWEPVFDALKGRYRLFSLDARGHGASDKPQRQDAYPWELSGRDILAVVDALGARGQMVGIGHSAGAAQLVYAEELAPGTFRKLVLIDAIVGPKTALGPAGAHLAASARRRRDVFPSREDARARLSAKRPMNLWTPEVMDQYVEHGLSARDDGQVELTCPKAIESWIYLDGGAAPVFENLSAIQTPTLLITGENSNVAPVVAIQRELLPHAEFRSVPGASHFIPQEQPEAVAACIDAWLGCA